MKSLIYHILLITIYSICSAVASAQLRPFHLHWLELQEPRKGRDVQRSGQFHFETDSYLGQMSTSGFGIPPPLPIPKNCVVAFMYLRSLRI